MANTDDNQYQIPFLTSNSTFLDWINHYNTEVVNKLNNVKIFDGASGDGIQFDLGTTASDDPSGGDQRFPDLPAGTVRMSLTEVIPNGTTFAGDVSINGTLNYDLGKSVLSTIRTRVNPLGGFTATSGFTFGMPIHLIMGTGDNPAHHGDTDYRLSRADDKNLAEVFGIVSGATWPSSSGTPAGPYTNDNTYVTVTIDGKIECEEGQSFDRALAMNSTEFNNPPVRGLSAGCVYFLSPGVSGGLTRQEPTMATQISKPVILGATGDVGYVLQYRGQYLQGSGTGGTGGIDNNRFFVNVSDLSIERGDVVGYDPELGGGEKSWYTVKEGTEYENAIGLCVRSPFTLDGSTYIELISTGFVDDLPIGSGTGVLYIGTDGKLTATLPPLAKPFAVAWQAPDGETVRGVIVNQNHGGGANFAGGGGQKSADGGENGNWAYRSTSIGGATYGSAINENILINGGFDVWQRRIRTDGPHGPTGTTYFADRWVRVDGLSGQTEPGTYSIERKEFAGNQTDVYGNPKYYARIQNDCSPVASRGDHLYVENRVEDVRTVRGEDVTISFWAKSGVTGTTMGVVINQYDGSNVSSTQPANVSLGTLWGKYEISMLVPTTTSTPTGKHYVGFGFDTSRLLTTYLDVTQVKVERGLVATRNADASQEEELNKCRRYYQRTYDIDEKNHSTTMLDELTPSVTVVDFMFTPEADHFEKFHVKMRGTPAITFYSPKTGYTGDVFNRTGNVDARNANGTIGHNGLVRNGSVADGTCITSTYATTNGIYMYVPCGAVLWDHLSVHYVADADLNENMPNKIR